MASTRAPLLHAANQSRRKRRAGLPDRGCPDPSDSGGAGDALRWCVAPSLTLPALAMLAALCAAALPAAAQSDVSGRTRVDARMPPWNSIGKLQAVAGSLRITCTAARIGPRTVLSAAHCLFNVRTGRYVAPGSLHFVAGLEGGSFAAAALAQSIEPAADYDPAESNLTRGSDWAVIELAGPVAAAGPPLPLAPSPPAAGTDVWVGGYAQDNPNVLTADLHCRITGATADARGRRIDRKSTRLNSSHIPLSRMPSSA